jgi:hypothetical protein
MWVKREKAKSGYVSKIASHELGEREINAWWLLVMVNCHFNCAVDVWWHASLLSRRLHKLHRTELVAVNCFVLMYAVPKWDVLSQWSDCVYSLPVWQASGECFGRDRGHVMQNSECCTIECTHRENICITHLNTDPLHDTTGIQSQYAAQVFWDSKSCMHM